MSEYCHKHRCFRAAVCLPCSRELHEAAIKKAVENNESLKRDIADLEKEVRYQSDLKSKAVEDERTAIIAEIDAMPWDPTEIGLSDLEENILNMIRARGEKEQA